MRRTIESAFKIAIALFLITGCQTIDSKGGSSVQDVTQQQDFALIRTGVSPELYQEALKQGEKAKEELDRLRKDQSLSATAKRILAEAEEAEEQGDQELYLAKIQEYSQLLNDEPIKRAAEAKELEARVLFSQLRLKEAQQAIEAAATLDNDNPQYLITLADYLRWNGDYQTMEQVALQAIALLETVNPIEQEMLSNAYSYLGLAHLYGGKYDLAHDPLQQSLKMNRQLFGEEHSEVATGLNNLAALYHSQGRYQEAEPLYLQALELHKKLLGEEHPSVAIDLNNLAALYQSQGRYKKAEPLYLQALEMDKKLLGQEHPSVARGFNNLAVLYESQGRYEEAEPLYLQALEMNKKLLGQEHPSVAIDFNNLAGLYRLQGRYEEAELLYLQALEMHKKLLGEEHPNTQVIKDNLAYLRQKMKE